MGWVERCGEAKEDDGVSGGDALCKKCDECQCGIVVGFCQWIGSGQEVA